MEFIRIRILCVIRDVEPSQRSDNVTRVTVPSLHVADY